MEKPDTRRARTDLNVVGEVRLEDVLHRGAVRDLDAALADGQAHMGVGA